MEKCDLVEKRSKERNCICIVPLVSQGSSSVCTYLVRVSSEDVYIVPPTSMCTGAVYLEAAATQGIPVIFWL